MKHLLVVVTLLGLLVGAWLWHEPSGLRRTLEGAGLDWPGADAVTARPAPAPQSVRKCVQGNQVLYTDGDCPSGSRPQAVADNRVTVLPAAPKPAAAGPSAPASGLPNVRGLLGTPQDGNLKDKMMDRVINQ